MQRDGLALGFELSAPVRSSTPGSGPSSTIQNNFRLFETPKDLTFQTLPEGMFRSRTVLGDADFRAAIKNAAHKKEL
jgi:hypothetical protein